MLTQAQKKYLKVTRTDAFLESRGVRVGDKYPIQWEGMGEEKKYGYLVYIRNRPHAMVIYKNECELQ